MQFDDENERPPWRLTSYAHERGEPSDLHGDTSFEELRWQQLQAARSGVPVAQVRCCVLTAPSWGFAKRTAVMMRMQVFLTLPRSDAVCCKHVLGASA